MVAFLFKPSVGILALEACETLRLLGRTLKDFEPDVKLISAAYLKPSVQGNRPETRDAMGICVATRREEIRSLPIKSEERQHHGR
jgi:transposase